MVPKREVSTFHRKHLQTAQIPAAGVWQLHFRWGSTGLPVIMMRKSVPSSPDVPRAINRERAAARDSSEPRGKLIISAAFDVAGSKLELGPFLRLSVIPDCLPVLRLEWPSGTNWGGSHLGRMPQAPEWSFGQTSHSG